MTDSIDTEKPDRSKDAHEFFVYDITNLMSWLVERKIFESSELDGIRIVNLSENHLKLLYAEERDPNIISLIYGMSDGQLSRFDRINLSSKGHRAHMKMDTSWLSKATYLSREGIPADQYFFRH